MPYHQKHPYLASIWYIIRFKLREVRQKLCRHRFHPMNTRVICDGKGRVYITETCEKCGKRFTFSTTERALGIPERR